MEKIECRLTPEIKRAILVAMARQTTLASELDASSADLDATEDAGWLRRMNNLPHSRRAYRVMHLGMSQIMLSSERRFRGFDYDVPT